MCARVCVYVCECVVCLCVRASVTFQRVITKLETCSRIQRTRFRPLTKFNSRPSRLPNLLELHTSTHVLISQIWALLPPFSTKSFSTPSSQSWWNLTKACGPVSYLKPPHPLFKICFCCPRLHLPINTFLLRGLCELFTERTDKKKCCPYSVRIEELQKAKTVVVVPRT